AVEDGLEMHRSLPELIDVAKGLFGVVDVDLLLFVHVPEIQLAVAPVIAVFDDDVWVAKVRHAGDDHVANTSVVFLDYLELIAFQLVDVEVQVVDQILGEVIPDEGDVALHLPHLEDLRASLARDATK